MPPARHILIVDDHAEVRAVLARVVAQLCPHATIVEAAHGAEVLSAIIEHHPDLLITDYQMPVMGGLELVRTLGAQGATMPTLVLSSDTSIAEGIFAAGATAFCLSHFASVRSGNCSADYSPLPRHDCWVANQQSPPLSSRGSSELA